MNVFPETMNKIDLNDPKTALSQLEHYIRYIVERVQFSTNGLVKTVASSMTTAEVVEQLTQLRTEVTRAVSTVNSYSARINTLESNTADLQTELDSQRTELADTIADLETLIGTVSDIETALTDLDTALSTLQTQVESYLPQTGQTSPTTQTEGTVGQMYLDTVSGKLYILVSDENDEYTWYEINMTAPTPEPTPEPDPGA